MGSSGMGHMLWLSARSVSHTRGSASVNSTRVKEYSLGSTVATRRPKSHSDSVRVPSAGKSKMKIESPRLSYVLHYLVTHDRPLNYMDGLSGTDLTER